MKIHAELTGPPIYAIAPDLRARSFTFIQARNTSIANILYLRIVQLHLGKPWLTDFKGFTTIEMVDAWAEGPVHDLSALKKVE